MRIISYDERGYVESVVDDRGVGYFFEYSFDSVKKLYYAMIRSSSGRIKEVWYDIEGDTVRVDINGRTIRRLIKDGRNVEIVDEKGGVTRKEYDEWVNLTKIIRPDGSETSFEYDLRFNKISRVTNPLGVVTEYDYDENANLVEKREAVGAPLERVFTYTYDEWNQLISATSVGDENTETATTTITWDDRGNLASITDPMGNVTRVLDYNTMGSPKKIEDARGNSWEFEYDAIGRLISRKNPLDGVTSIEYDGVNNPTAMVNALLKRYEFEYDGENNMIKATDPHSKFRTIDYNTDNLPTRYVDQEGRISSPVYDNEGRLTKTVDGAGKTIALHYDEAVENPAHSNRPVRIDFPTFSRVIQYDNLQRITRAADIDDGDVEHAIAIEYDAVGNMVAFTNQEGETRRYEYDELGRLIKTTDPMGGQVHRVYNNRGNLIELLDPKGGSTFYEYDKNNSLVKLIRPMLQEIAFKYDANGNRTAVIDSKGQRIEYEYDGISRLIRAKYFNTSNDENPVKTVDFTYDALGRLLSYDDGVISATYTYDDLGRKTLETLDYGPFTMSHGYTYYANGLKKSFTGPDGEAIEYSYDENNRLIGISIPDQGFITYNNHKWNSPTQVTMPGGSSVEINYNSLMEISSIIGKDPSRGSIMSHEYQYSLSGNVLSKSTEHGDYSYLYDKLDRLVEANNPLNNDEAYTYDDMGNRLTAEGVPGTWSYNANNELTGHASSTFDYDANGNMTRKSVGPQDTVFIYDIEDRLIRVEDGSSNGIADYYYGPFGRRLWKEVDGVRTYFVYSDEGLIGEYDESGQEIKSYGYKPGSTWGTDPLFQKSGEEYYWYLNDHQGTPQKVINTAGETVWSATYDSFGNAQIETETIENNFRFPGQYYDEETGLYYNWNRYYDPNIGRYLSKDPLKAGLNLYAYVKNNPGRWIDPYGLCASAASHADRIISRPDLTGEFKHPFADPVPRVPFDYWFESTWQSDLSVLFKILALTAKGREMLEILMRAGGLRILPLTQEIRDRHNVPKARGLYDQNENAIYLDPDLSNVEAAHVLAHEIQHASDKDKGYSDPHDQVEQERNAVSAQLEVYNQLKEINPDYSDAGMEDRQEAKDNGTLDRYIKQHWRLGPH